MITDQPVAFCCRPGRGADGEFSFGASKEKPPCFAPDRKWQKYGMNMDEIC